MSKGIAYVLEGLKESVSISSILIASKLTNVKIDYKEANDLSFYIKNGSDKISSNLSILRYLAEVAPSSSLYGNTLYHEAQVNQYLDIFWNDLELPIYYNLTETDKYNFDVILNVIEDVLTSNTYLVASNITVADIYLYSIITFGINKKVLDKSKYQSITRWYSTLEKVLA